MSLGALRNEGVGVPETIPPAPKSLFLQKHCLACKHIPVDTELPETATSFGSVISGEQQLLCADSATASAPCGIETSLAPRVAAHGVRSLPHATSTCTR